MSGNQLVIGLTLAAALLVTVLVLRLAKDCGWWPFQPPKPPQPPEFEEIDPVLPTDPGLVIERLGPDAPAHMRVGHYIPLPEGDLQVGKLPRLPAKPRSATLILNEQYVSRAHFSIESEEDGAQKIYRIRDLMSTNGTELGEVKLEPHVPEILQHNDLIQIGNGNIFRFHQPLASNRRIPPNRLWWGPLRFGDYLADGGMARIFRGSIGSIDRPTMDDDAHDAEKQRRERVWEQLQSRELSTVSVAIKVPKDYAKPDPDQESQILRESLIMRNLVHPHIVWLISSGRLGPGLAYLTMEYMPGGSLTTLIRQEERLPENVALPIAVQIADALMYIHSRNIVHCDIKPDNVLFDAQGNARLADFGICWRPGDPFPEFGHEGYSSPEHFQGAQEASSRAEGPRRLSPASDVFSLGVVLYEMLVGRRPIAPNETTSEHKPIHPPSSEEGIVVSKALEQVLMAMLDPDPSKRPPLSALNALRVTVQ